MSRTAIPEDTRELARSLRAQYPGIEPEAAERAATRMAVNWAFGFPEESAVTTLVTRNVVVTVPAEVPVYERVGDTLRLTVLAIPRTKKNHGRGVAKQSMAYVRFRQQMLDALAPVVLLLHLPLPERAYNIAATYYVDKPGERADRPGLDQALFDVLQDARVVTNDWQFRRTDGTRIVCGDERPRVEVVITPITED